MKRNFLIFASFFLPSFCWTASVPLDKVLSPKSMRVLRESGLGYWDLRDAIFASTQSREYYAWLADYHKIQTERSLPAWRQQPSCEPVPELPSIADRDDKEKGLVRAVLSLLKQKAKKEADEEVSSFEKNEAASKKNNKCFLITVMLLSIGAIISGVVPCAPK